MSRSSDLSKVTKPKPRLRPVSRSWITCGGGGGIQEKEVPCAVGPNARRGVGGSSRPAMRSAAREDGRGRREPAAGRHDGVATKRRRHARSLPPVNRRGRHPEARIARHSARSQLTCNHVRRESQGESRPGGGSSDPYASWVWPLFWPPNPPPPLSRSPAPSDLSLDDVAEAGEGLVQAIVISAPAQAADESCRGTRGKGWRDQRKKGEVVAPNTAANHAGGGGSHARARTLVLSHSAKIKDARTEGAARVIDTTGSPVLQNFATN